MRNESSSNSKYTDQRHFKQFDLVMLYHYARVQLDWSQWKAGRGQVEVGWSRHRIKYWALPDSAKFYYRPQLHCEADDIFNKEHHYFATVAPSAQRMPLREKYLRASSLLKSKGSLVVWNLHLVALLPWWKSDNFGWVLGRVENRKTLQNQMAQCFFIGFYDIETGHDFYFFQKSFFDGWKWISKKSIFTREKWPK